MNPSLTPRQRDAFKQLYIAGELRRSTAERLEISTALESMPALAELVENEGLWFMTEAGFALGESLWGKWTPAMRKFGAA